MFLFKHTLFKKGIYGLLGTFILSTAAASPPYQQNNSFADSTLIALPAHTVEGRLANGLHYLILPNATPARTVEMRLVMKLGAVQETEEQKGCAHFLEHMAFAGTRHFPKRSMIDYLESLGMKFGRDINAVTGYDRTIFMLTVPMTATDSGVLDSTLLVLKDWLTGIDFKAPRIRQERGVILEELRTYRNDDVFYDLKIGQSRFKDRMPLGSAEDISRVKRRQLIDFYKKWYQPQLASVVVVGDVSPKQVEQRIHHLFANIPAKEVKDYQIYPLEYTPGTRMQEVRDSIHQRSVLEMILPHEGTIGRSHTSLLQKERERLAAYALDRRLSARHLSCSVSDEWYLSDSHHFVLSFSGTSAQMLLKRIERVGSEIKLLQETGWDEEEFTQIKSDFAQAISINEEGRTSATYCDDFADYILQGDRYLHNEKDLEILRKGLLETEQKDLQQHLSKIVKAMEQTLLLAYRNNAGAGDELTQEEVKEAWEKGLQQKATDFHFRSFRYEEKKVSTPSCLTEKLTYHPEWVKQETYLPNTRVTDVRLTNGMRLIFRPTPEADETLLVNFVGKDGLAALSPDKYHQYESTAGFMEMGGIEQVKYDTLCEYMAQAGLLLNLSIGAYWHDLLGTSPAEKSGELFQLIREKLLRPERCYKDFEEVRQDELKSLGKKTVLDQMMQRASDRLLTNRMDSLVGNSPSTWFRNKTVRDVETLNLDSITDYFCRLYAQLDGTTVILTGNYDLEKVKQEAVSVFGSLQSQPPHPAMRRQLTAYQPPKKAYVEGFPNDNASQTVLEYVYPGVYEPGLKNGLVLKLLRDVLQDRLLRVLREEENVVYSPYTSLYYNGVPQKNFYFNLSLSVDTENSKRTDALLQKIIRQLQKEEISQEELEKLKRAFLVNKDQVLTEAAATDWRNIIATLIKNGEALEDFEEYQQQLDAITPATLHQAFRKCFDEEHRILLYLGKHQIYK